jgi:8-oxo-dGTP pyrophosphatase MutT (NUDIX family)
MQQTVQKFGAILFWLAWPAFWLFSPHRPRTRVLVTAGGKVLVVKGLISTGKWSLPGGGLHRGEEPLTGALRELAEETGLRLRRDQLAPPFTRVSREHGLRAPTSYFAAQLTHAADVRKQFLEITDVAWVPRSALHSQNSAREVLEALGVPAIRE